MIINAAATLDFAVKDIVFLSEDPSHVFVLKVSNSLLMVGVVKVGNKSYDQFSSSVLHAHDYLIPMQYS